MSETTIVALLSLVGTPAGSLGGKALDFRIEGKSSADVLAYVQKQPECRYAYAIDSQHIHMDVE